MHTKSSVGKQALDSGPPNNWWKILPKTSVYAYISIYTHAYNTQHGFYFSIALSDF